MRSDVTVGQRTEDGVAQRVKPDITIGMRGEASVMWDFDTAEAHRPVAVTETVDVETVARPDVDWRGVMRHVEFSGAGDQGRQDGKIFGGRQLHQTLVTRYGGDQRTPSSS